MSAAQVLEQGGIALAKQGRHDNWCWDRFAQISSWLPSSTTRLVGRRKNSIALSSLRSIQANNFSRQIAMPGRDEAIKVCRARKKLVSIILKRAPHSVASASAAGTSGSSMKP